MKIGHRQELDIDGSTVVEQSTHPKIQGSIPAEASTVKIAKQLNLTNEISQVILNFVFDKL